MNRITRDEKNILDDPEVLNPAEKNLPQRINFAGINW